MRFGCICNIITLSTVQIDSIDDGLVRAFRSKGRGQIGHSVFSEDAAFVAKVDDGDGEHIRIYEYDRFNGTIWQVDLLLTNRSSSASPSSHAAWIHVKLMNPTKDDLRGYWWTNTARCGGTLSLKVDTCAVCGARRAVRVCSGI